MRCRYSLVLFFFFNHTAPTDIYTLSLHDALPIWTARARSRLTARAASSPPSSTRRRLRATSSSARDRKSTRLKLQSRQYLVCRLLLEKKKQYRAMTRADRRDFGTDQSHDQSTWEI